jgi:hypothetical protein
VNGKIEAEEQNMHKRNKQLVHFSKLINTDLKITTNFI